MYNAVDSRSAALTLEFEDISEGLGKLRTAFDRRDCEPRLRFCTPNYDGFVDSPFEVGDDFREGQILMREALVIG